eukprot:TRINITY_DN7917_c0_g3_i2.p1 TRINITY_DN7917_c0_g3~~TRINITY_DN7917_c0_g3_i2.p1  ORF type:complete len:162 (+),score=13.27 TRINITY_DN7917_c0_g3_i2:135-620(+)
MIPMNYPIQRDHSVSALSELELTTLILAIIHVVCSCAFVTFDIAVLSYHYEIGSYLIFAGLFLLGLLRLIGSGLCVYAVYADAIANRVAVLGLLGISFVAMAVALVLAITQNHKINDNWPMVLVSPHVIECLTFVLTALLAFVIAYNKEDEKYIAINTIKA